MTNEEAKGNLLHAIRWNCMPKKEALDMAIKALESKDVKPSYRGIPTFRNYEDYHDAEQYTKGWNDAMDYIFPESKKARERIAVRKNMKLLEAESEEVWR